MDHSVYNFKIFVGLMVFIGSAFFYMDRQFTMDAVAKRTDTEHPGFQQRVSDFNWLILTTRERLLARPGSSGPYKWTGIATTTNRIKIRVKSQAHTTVREYEDSFLDRIGENRDVTSLVLPWDNSSTLHNVVLSVYYPWAATERLCAWIRSPRAMAKNRHKYHVMFNFTCSTDIRRTLKAGPPEPGMFRRKLIPHKKYWPLHRGALPVGRQPRYPMYSLYINIMHHGIVTDKGVVLTKQLTVYPNTCKSDMFPISFNSRKKNLPLHNEVFVIAQRWGDGNFHRNIEVVPRLVPFAEFLRNAPHVKVMVPTLDDERMEFVFDLLGINHTRAVSGALRANTVYLPQGASCVTPVVQHQQLTAALYRKYIHAKLSPRRRNKLILISRTGTRKLVEHESLMEYLGEMATSHGLDFVLWPDNPVLPRQVAMRMFHEAVMVVAPHGAGEFNLIFSQPGTVVIEIVCNIPHVNLCYQRLAHVLGHRYYGIPSQKGCEDHVTVDIEVVKYAVEFFLNHIQMDSFD